MIVRVLASLALIVAGCTVAQAQAGFYLPSSPTSAGQDEFHAADGTSCRTTMDGMKRMEVGSYGAGGDNLYGSAYSYSYPYGSTTATKQPTQKNGGVYARFSMSLDASPSRMDCNKLYELELERRRLEIEVMKRSLASTDQKLDDLKRKDLPRDSAPPRASAPPRGQRASSGLRGSFPPL
ncbi:hypothetical protein [Methylobacterium sp. J-092]|uniref:hypothetical protein n=1 Tax=Methylobacterium sp. J-092 TaxID=2836667 RepID=UPI001FBA623B|nr:hypothetical protein [Methylobacterium sp. J-092]MCJ2009370.1 hypothetical protein [Methylobacterium sp. J-092]